SITTLPPTGSPPAVERASAPPRITLLQAIQTAAALLVLVSLMFLMHLGANPEIAFIFAGAFAIHLGTRPAARELVWAGIGAALLIALYLLAGAQTDSYWISRTAAIGAALGFGSLAVLCVGSFADRPVEARIA